MKKKRLSKLAKIKRGLLGDLARDIIEIMDYRVRTYYGLEERPWGYSQIIIIIVAPRHPTPEIGKLNDIVSTLCYVRPTRKHPFSNSNGIVNFGKIEFDENIGRETHTTQINYYFKEIESDFLVDRFAFQGNPNPNILVLKPFNRRRITIYVYPTIEFAKEEIVGKPDELICGGISTNWFEKLF